MPEEKQKKLIEKIKNIFMLKQNDENGEKTSKRKIENLVVFVIILIITVIFINAIWNSSSKKDNKDSLPQDRTLAQSIQTNTNSSKQISLESKLEDILQNIEGVGKVKVLLTYSESSKTLAMYNEDTTKSDTEETDSRSEVIEK